MLIKNLVIAFGMVVSTTQAHAIFFDADGRSYDDDYTGRIFSAEYEEWIIPADFSKSLKLAPKMNRNGVFFDHNGVVYPADYDGEIWSAEYEEWIVPSQLSPEFMPLSGQKCIIVGLEVADEQGMVWSIEYEEWIFVIDLCDIAD